MRPSGSSGVKSRDSIYRSGTSSAHTVCQMPLCGVYQMPPRFVFCLPRARGTVSVSSRTATVRVFSPSRSSFVMSRVKAV